MLKSLRLLAALALGLTAQPAFADASLWPSSRVPFFDTDGQPATGWTAEFFDCETTTPQVVYADSSLSTALDQPVEADARGMFTAIFLSPDPGCYRVRVEDADGVVVYDDDGVAVAQAATFVPPEAGATAPELLFVTGMLEPWYGTTAPSGWVRCNARTIGSASSGATERANADTEDLFIHLWTVDANLSVSSGRGGSASGDFAANKTITLPDCRDRALSAMATMGNSDAGLVDDAYVTSGTNTSTLGAKAGVDDVALTEAQLASHTHTFTGSALAAHGHPVSSSGAGGDTSTDTFGGFPLSAASPSTQAAYTGTPSQTHGQQIGGQSAGTPAGTNSNTGSGAAHNNMPPSLYVTFLLKL